MFGHSSRDHPMSKYLELGDLFGKKIRLWWKESRFATFWLAFMNTRRMNFTRTKYTKIQSNVKDYLSNLKNAFTKSKRSLDKQSAKHSFNKPKKANHLIAWNEVEYQPNEFDGSFFSKLQQTKQKTPNQHRLVGPMNNACKK